MDISTIEAVKLELAKQNPTFRGLVEQHQKFEKRLTELSELTHPKEEELLEEATLKKKKLLIKDEMYSMMEQHSSLH